MLQKNTALGISLLNAVLKPGMVIYRGGPDRKGYPIILTHPGLWIQPGEAFEVLGIDTEYRLITIQSLEDDSKKMDLTLDKLIAFDFVLSCPEELQVLATKRALAIHEHQDN